MIVGRERPHPGAQLRFTDADGMRLACFVTNMPDLSIADMEPTYERHENQAEPDAPDWANQCSPALSSFEIRYFPQLACRATPS
ncbi:hypothetical protein ACIOJD_30560 [Streptomyces sp. NPDC088116]|uniref:hypothetical protein n=1 Tax=Streptomyces sp. NPDC088116 TaxID=3365825 RepID=UPI0037F2F952